MSFDVSADAYDRFMGRFSQPLAGLLVAMCGVAAGQNALDVGCGSGAVTGELVARLGAHAVTAVDPSASFVEAAAARFPDVDIRRASAEDLPFEADRFDCVFAQLVVHFMTDPVAGLREMARVARPGGLVVACVWDHAGGRGPLAQFWQAVLELDPGAHDESGLAGVREGHLVELLTAAGLRDVRPAMLTVRVAFASFDEWWEPFTFGVGPAGAYVSSLDSAQREALRARCARLFPELSSFEIPASAWVALGTAP